MRIGEALGLRWEDVELVKCELHVRQRADKHYKIGLEDFRNIARRKEYLEAYDEMLERTDRPHAPWHVVPAESKRFARVEVMRLVNEAIEAGMRHWGQEPPPRP